MLSIEASVICHFEAPKPRKYSVLSAVATTSCTAFSDNASRK